MTQEASLLHPCSDALLVQNFNFTYYRHAMHTWVTLHEYIEPHAVRGEQFLKALKRTAGAVLQDFLLFETLVLSLGTT